MFLNWIKTFLLLFGLSALLMFVGHLIGGTQGVTFALIFSLVINGIMYFFSDKIVLRMYRAQPLSKETYGYVYDIVEQLCKKMNMPMPKLWLIPCPIANAFATGRNPNHSSIALTPTILALLDTNELRGVLAHELSHIKNRDILVGTISATLASAISYLAYMMRHMAFWGSMSNRRRNSNPIMLFFMGILIPLGAMLIQLAVSRSREYLADETGSSYSKDPLALASALKKLHHHGKYEKEYAQNNANQTSTASLFIVYPFSGSGWSSLFSTHPPIPKRIERLHTIYEKMFS